MNLLKENGFQFCPKCGSERLFFQIKNLYCKSCGFVYYQNTAVGVGVIISRHAKIPKDSEISEISKDSEPTKSVKSAQELLLVVRAREPALGYYDLPGGFVDPGENLEQALLREVTEELGREIYAKLSRPQYLLSADNHYRYKDNTYAVCDVFFRAELEGEAELIPADDVESFVWCPADEIDFERIAFPSAKTALQLWLQEQH